jgi:hypothetical protein
MYWAIDAILARLDEGIGLTQAVLRRHTMAQAQQKTTTLTLAPRVQGIMVQLQPAHPQGFAPSPTDTTRWIVSLEGTGRHLYFEALTHLYNEAIQKIFAVQRRGILAGNRRDPRRLGGARCRFQKIPDAFPLAWQEGTMRP